jgi:DNA-binding response OmpR family regulator
MAIHRVLYLDDDDDLREVVGDILATVGVAVDAVGSLAQLETLASHDAAAFDLAVLDINLGPGVPSGIDAYRWLKEHKFVGRTVFLTGHARSHPLVAEALRLGDAMVYDKPISAAEFRALVT